jgi:epsilon-lactone hydrolase
VAESANLLPFPQAPDGVELRHLRSFMAVAEELNFGRAAERLYLSQPALSRQIRALERFVGCKLLNRTTRRVDLTLAGEVLLGRARAVLRDVDAAVSETRAAAGEIEARVSRLWAELAEIAAEGFDLQALRDAYEDMHARFDMPPGLEVRSVNAGGVPALAVMPQAETELSLLYLHGGGYVMGSAYGLRHMAGALATASGAGALIADYRLAPEHPFPAALDDAISAYLWMLDRGTDAGRMTLVGESIGGGLALGLLLTLKRRGLPLPGGVILLCPDLDMGDTSIRALPDDDPQKPVLLQLKRFMLESYLPGGVTDDPVLDPASADLSGLPPMLVQGAAHDPVAGESLRLAEAARQHGVEVELDMYPGALHGFQLLWSFLPDGAAAIEAAGAFARRVRA